MDGQRNQASIEKSIPSRHYGRTIPSELRTRLADREPGIFGRRLLTGRNLFVAMLLREHFPI